MGGEILDGLEFGGPLARIVRHHHENWDGSGYPDALSAQTIPIGARILAIVDCYDALTSERPYREPMSHGRAVDLIVARRATMYDPAILDVFVRVVQRLRSSDAVRDPQRVRGAFIPAARGEGDDDPPRPGDTVIHGAAARGARVRRGRRGRRRGLSGQLRDPNPRSSTRGCSSSCSGSRS